MGGLVGKEGYNKGMERTPAYYRESCGNRAIVVSRFQGRKTMAWINKPMWAGKLPRKEILLGGRGGLLRVSS